MKELQLFKKDGIAVVSSRVVAEDFGKRHDHVLAKIEEKIATLKFGALSWFIESEYNDAQGKLRKEYLLTRDGFSFIVMGFTGSKADEFKIKYIEAFNAMEKAHLQPKTTAEMFAMSSQIMLDMERKLNVQEKLIAENSKKVESIKEVVALNTANWRSDCRDLINKMANSIGGHNAYQEIQREIYKLTEQRAGIKLEVRLTNMKHRSLGRGMSKSAVAKLNKQDVIADDKKAIEIYVAVVKDFAIKHGVA